MDCSLPGSSVHGIFQARVLEWGAIASVDVPCLSLSQFFKELCFESALTLNSEDLLQRLALFSLIFTCVCTPDCLNQVNSVYGHTTLNMPELIKQVS